jgi:hypothetical protein
MGIRQLAVVNNTLLRFLINYDSTNDVLFPINSEINSLGYLIISQISCPSSYIEWPLNACNTVQESCEANY